jgi:outer membrane protein
VRSMRTWIIAFAVAITAAVGGIALPVHSAAAQAAQNVPLVVGIVDVQKILTSSLAGQSLEKAWSAKSKTLNAEIGKAEQDLRARRQKLDQQRSSLPPADYQTQMQLLEKDVLAARKNFNTKRKTLVQAKNKGLEQIFKTLDGVIQDVAKKKGLTLVLNRSLVVLTAENWDITAEVQKGLDAKLPKVGM